ncbi:MAG: nucleotidyltransferase domain-containing protein [Phycisphaerae bacterium]|nr:nucleotidyltransferase domain-containing protein [Phycisphaerae bacterium]
MTVDVTKYISGVVSLLKNAGAKEVYVFGSLVKGQLTEHSDVDIAVSGLPVGVLYRLIAEATEMLNRPVDLVELDKDNPFTRYLKTSEELRRVG